MSVVQSLAPLAANANYTSAAQYVQRATAITGTVFADKAGTLLVQQGGDGINWDNTTALTVTAGTGFGFDVELTSSYWQITYENGSTAQTSFRLYADPRDPYGDFLAPAQAPSAGGAYAVLQATSNGSYTYVGRFNGADGWAANQNAALQTKQSGQYASFLVDEATVSTETILSTTEHAPASF